MLDKHKLILFSDLTSGQKLHINQVSQNLSKWNCNGFVLWFRWAKLLNISLLKYPHTFLWVSTAELLLLQKLHTVPVNVLLMRRHSDLCGWSSPPVYADHLLTHTSAQSFRLCTNGAVCHVATLNLLKARLIFYAARQLSGVKQIKQKKLDWGIFLSASKVVSF